MQRTLSRLVSLTALVSLAFVCARLIAADVRYAVVVVPMAAAFFVPAWLARRRMRRLLLSGDIARIIGTWQGQRSRAETLAPLVTATAYAAYGFIEQARESLSKAARGAAWEAAREQRLFVEALLDVYEGERSRALEKAAELEQLPLPNVGFSMRRKVALLRRGVGALARAFAHASRAGDEAVLRDAGRSSPLVHWAMRYARAVFLVDAGRASEARTLLANAPVWPDESAFRSFHDELASRVAS